MSSFMKSAIFAALVMAVTFAGHRWTGGFPEGQTVRVVLGDEAPRVREVRLRYVESAEGEPTEEMVREAIFSFDLGKAPRILTHHPRLRNSKYTFEMDLLADQNRATISREGTLSGNPLVFDVSQSVPR